MRQGSHSSFSLGSVFLLVTLLSACKHPLEIQGEGDIVERLYGERGCTLQQFRSGAEACTENTVIDTAYVASYQAVAAPGWVFSHWEGTKCNTVTPEGYCEYDVGQFWIDATNEYYPDSTVPSLVAVFVVDAPTYFEEAIAEPVIADRCVNCHVEGGVAGNTRMVYRSGDSASVVEHNYGVLSDFLNADSGIPELVLSKVRGVSHGGGVQLAAGEEDYEALNEFIKREIGCFNCDDVAGGDFFAGVTMADAQATLRRASLLLAGRLPTASELNSVRNANDAKLRKAVLKLMQGDGFHQFLLRSANDRLLTDAFLSNSSGVDLRPANLAHAQYPELSNRAYEATNGDLSSGAPDQFWRWVNEMGYGMARAPLKLIAHVVENNRPYTEILTADYVMQNSALAEIYRSNINFSNDSYSNMKSGPNRGQILLDEELEIEEGAAGASRVLSHSGFIDYPITGVLNTSAFLSRYPTTETNRNRARARWTYYHFLGVDIENSASRTTDPEALADTNNPTLNNPACTACHVIMDPVAGAYRDYGVDSYYLESYGGIDSLPDQYKYPETRLAIDGETFDVQSANGSTRDYTARVSVEAGNRQIAFQFNNAKPGFENAEGFPRAVGVTQITVKFGSRVPFSEQGINLGNLENASASGSNVFDNLYAFYGDGALLTFPVNVPGDGELTITATALASVLDDGINPSFSIGVTEVEPTLYEEGDRWFRDMLPPGFNDRNTPDYEDSLRWLAEHIANDPRFAQATVRFWWQSLMKAEPLQAPAVRSDRFFDQKLRAFEQQNADIGALASDFRNGYKLKELLADMVMSPWFRANGSLRLSAKSVRRNWKESVSEPCSRQKN